MLVKKLVHGVTIIALSFATSAFASDDYPSRPIQLIIPFAPGGATDVVGRLAAAHLSEKLGQRMIPENRAGAGGSIGAASLVRSDNDGYTLGIATVSTHVVNPILMGLDYDPHEELIPIVRIAAVPNLLVVNPSVPAKNMEKFISLLKENPEKYTFASAGVGGINHIMCEMFMASSDTLMTHIPYKGSGPALGDVISGRVDAICDQTTSSLAHIKAGSLRALAVAAPQRLPSLPDVPTFEELGLPDVNSMAWYGIMSPRGTSSEIIEKINIALNAALQEPEFKKALEGTGSIAIGGTQEDFVKVIREESDRIGGVVRERNITLQ